MKGYFPIISMGGGGRKEGREGGGDGGREGKVKGSGSKEKEGQKEREVYRSLLYYILQHGQLSHYPGCQCGH